MLLSIVAHDMTSDVGRRALALRMSKCESLVSASGRLAPPLCVES